MALPESGALGLGNIAAFYEDDGDHSLTEFYMESLPYIDQFRSGDAIREWEQYGISGGDIFTGVSMPAWTAPAGTTVQYPQNSGHLDLLIAPPAPLPNPSTGYTKVDYPGPLKNRFDNYDFEVILSSTSTDDDSIGVVAIAEIDYTSGEYAVLTVNRSMGNDVESSNDLLKVTYIDDLVGNVNVVSVGANVGLSQVTYNANDANNSGWQAHGPCRLLVSRRDDLVHIWVSNDETADWVYNTTVDLKDLPSITGSPKAYEALRGRCTYGVMASSQKWASIEVLRHPTQLPQRLPRPSTPDPLSDPSDWFGNLPTTEITEEVEFIPTFSDYSGGFEFPFVPYDRISAVGSSENGAILSKYLETENESQVDYQAVIEQVPGYRWGYSVEPKQWTISGSVTATGHDGAQTTTVGVSSDAIGLGSNNGFTQGAVDYIYARSDQPNTVYLRLSGMAASSLYGKQVLVEVREFGRVLSDQVVDSDVWDVVLTNPEVNFYNALSQSPVANVYIGQWVEDELLVGFSPIDPLIAAGMEPDQGVVDGDRSSSFETGVGAIVPIPQSGVYVNTLISSIGDDGPGEDAALILIMGHGEDITGVEVTVTVGTLPPYTVVIGSTTAKGNEDVLMSAVSIPGIYDYLIQNVGNQIPIGVTKTDVTKKSTVCHYDAYARDVSYIGQETLETEITAIADTGDHALVVVPDDYVVPDDVAEVNLRDLGIEADAVCVDGNDVYILVGQTLKRSMNAIQEYDIYLGNPSSVGVLNDLRIPQTFSRADLTVIGNTLVILLGEGSTTTLVSIGRNHHGYFTLKRIIDIRTSTDYDYYIGILATETNVGYLTNARRWIEFARLDTSRSMPISVSDFYGYSDRPVIRRTLTQADFQNGVTGAYPLSSTDRISTLEGYVNIAMYFGNPSVASDLILECHADIVGRSSYGAIGALIASNLPRGSTLTIILHSHLSGGGGNSTAVGKGMPGGPAIRFSSAGCDLIIDRRSGGKLTGGCGGGAVRRYTYQWTETSSGGSKLYPTTNTYTRSLEARAVGAPGMPYGHKVANVLEHGTDKNGGPFITSQQWTPLEAGRTSVGRRGKVTAISPMRHTTLTGGPSFAISGNHLQSGASGGGGGIVTDHMDDGTSSKSYAGGAGAPAIDFTGRNLIHI